MSEIKRFYLANAAFLACVLLTTHCGRENAENGVPQSMDGYSAGAAPGTAGAGAPALQGGSGGAGGTVDIGPTGESGSAGHIVAGTGGSTSDAGAPPGDASTPEDANTGDSATDDGQTPQSATGTLPPITDPKQPGSFTATSETPGPAGYVLFYPKELGRDDVKHPIVSWGPGAVENAGVFVTMLNHLASHGFAAISYDATPQGQELVTAIDWMIAENDRADSVFYQKLDTSRIAAGGHSAGSLATFRIGADPRLTTTMHISGGTFDPHTDINNLHAPALMICGEPGGDGLLIGDVANPNCEIDFDNATVPVFYGITKGASHMTPTEMGDPTIRSHQLGAMVGWLRWQLAGDESFKTLFAGSSCTLCTDPVWSSAQNKNLN